MDKIAYLILSHSDSKHLKRMINVLDNNSDFFIHIDLKADIEQFKQEISKENVYFIEDRVPIYWGGFNMVDATKKLIKKALEKSNQYTHLVLLSGNDYPIKSSKEIYEFLCSMKGREIIRAYYIDESNCEHCYDKIQTYRFNDLNMFKINFVNKVLKKLLTYMFSFIKKKEYIDINGDKIRVCYGSQWWAITPECASFILEYSQKNRKIDKYFKTSFAPDEMYFHTIIFNSKFKKNTLNEGIEKYDKKWKWNNIHYLDSSTISCGDVIKESIINDIKKIINRKKYIYAGSIKFFDETHYNQIINSNQYFVRKVNTEISTNLLDKIDANLK